jgi:signal transduction histidine kinase
VEEPQTPTTAALLRLGSLALDDWETALQEILKTDSNVLAVERVNYWRFRTNPPAIVCELGYDSSRQRFERGLVLHEPEATRYFEEIRRVQVLTIEDARDDLRSRDLWDYLKLHAIGALLDVGVYVGGSLMGILCHEHVGCRRRWIAQEHDFALSVAQIVAARLEARARSRAEENERRTALLGDVMARLGEVFDAGPAADVAVQYALPTLGDLATVVITDGPTVRLIASTHVDPERRHVLSELESFYPTTLEGPGFAVHAIRERQSLLVPRLTPETSGLYGNGDRYTSLVARLELKSAMAVPFSVRGELKGAMVFASNSKSYSQDDLRFAETYAERVGAALENALLYRKAQDAILARDRFLSLASHELRTPLTTLCLFAQSLARDSLSRSSRVVAQMSQKLVRQAARLDRLADRLLDAYKIGSGRPSIEREPVDLVEIVQDVTHGFEGTMDTAGSTLVLSGDNRLLGSFDPIRVQEVVGNLVDNAIKFGMGKPIEVDVRARGDKAVVRVRDHGLGISCEDQAAIFELYERGGAAQGLGGLGLGLHIVREIVQAHGGGVQVESLPGEGSTFTVELPLAEPHS